MPPRLPRTLFHHPTPSIVPRCINAIRNASTTPKILAARPIPPPTPWVPSVEVFLSLIGREMSQYSSKISSWDALFRLTSDQLKGLGLENTKKRRYLLWWRERFRTGIWGVGGEFKYVNEEGIAYVKTVQVPGVETLPDGKSDTQLQGLTPLRNPGMKKIVINVPPPNQSYDVPESVNQASGVHITELDVIGGRYFEPIAGGNGQWSRISRKEGMWEEKQGKKKQGGERRRKQFLHDQYVTDRKATKDS